MALAKIIQAIDAEYNMRTAVMSGAAYTYEISRLMTAKCDKTAIVVANVQKIFTVFCTKRAKFNYYLDSIPKTTQIVCWFIRWMVNWPLGMAFHLCWWTSCSQRRRQSNTARRAWKATRINRSPSRASHRRRAWICRMWRRGGPERRIYQIMNNIALWLHLGICERIENCPLK